MSAPRFAAAAALVAAIGALTAPAASAAVPWLIAQPTGVHVQQVALTIQSGDRMIEPNFALAPGVPVRITITNFTHEFHTLTIPGLHVSALIGPSVGHTPRVTTVAFTTHATGPYDWHCVICPSGAHGVRHAMGGTIYMIIGRSVLR